MTPFASVGQCSDPVSDKCISATGVVDTAFGEDDFASEKLSIEGVCIYTQADGDNRAFIRNTGGSSQHSSQSAYFAVEDGLGNEIPVAVAIRASSSGTWRAIDAGDGFKEIVFDAGSYPSGQQDCNLSGDTHFIRTVIFRSALDGMPAGIYSGTIELELSPD
ncbi:hypothetical protein PXK18_18770 [Phaeobacter gallaeciensis]|nr:hypothetical protein [Phaeobacter gallaeciensis]